MRVFFVNNCMDFLSSSVSLNCGSGAMTFPVMSEGVREVADSHNLEKARQGRNFEKIC
jgi:hypothetical protein